MPKYFLIVTFILLSLVASYLVLNQQIFVRRFSVTEQAVATPRASPRALTLDTLFNESDVKGSRVLLTGDVLLARSINAKMIARQDTSWPFAKTSNLLQSADITFINLETPLISDCPITISGMLFCGQSANATALANAGIDVANLANNHIGNHGIEGVEETKVTLKAANIQYSGTEEVVIEERNGVRFAFLGFNDVDTQPGVLLADRGEITRKIAEANAISDVIIVQFHWGNEYQRQPSDRQKELAHYTIDAGADLVIGNHPHWWQPMEIYQNKVISYSHGNFIFDQMWSYETREGLVAAYLFEGTSLVSIEVTPVLIEEYGQPRILEGTEKEQVLNRLKMASEELRLSY
ncbi:MAG: CapA family protein [bacterium]|nr:CapA family protein [bacterium]